MLHGPLKVNRLPFRCIRTPAIHSPILQLARSLIVPARRLFAVIVIVVVRFVNSVVGPCRASIHAHSGRIIFFVLRSKQG